jgi:serine/threonine protein kinase
LVYVKIIFLGGELLDHILKAKYFDEREAAAIMLKLAQILAYLHANQVSDNLPV